MLSFSCIIDILNIKTFWPSKYTNKKPRNILERLNIMYNYLYSLNNLYKYIKYFLNIILYTIKLLI